MPRIIAHVSALRPLKDSVNWQAIPADAPMVAGYVPPSSFAWPAAAWAKFTNSIQIRITPSASTYGCGIQVLDVEQSDATPGQVPGWVTASRGANQEPTAYMTYGNWANVINACLDARVAVPQFWVADWNDAQDLPSITVGNTTYTAVAHQYADPATSGGDWDSSVVAEFWPGVDQGVTMDWSDPAPNSNGQTYGGLIEMVGVNFDYTAAAFYNETVPDGIQQILTQLTAIQGSLSTEEAALLAAIKAEPVASLDPTAVAQALESAGLPAQLVAAFVAILNKAAGGSTS